VSQENAEAIPVAPIGFELLYEQGPCLAVSKPGGLLTQSPPGIDNLEARVRQFLLHREQRHGNIYLTVAHRLDRPVSGVILLNRHVRAARRVAEQFQRRAVDKIYYAVVEGCLAEPEGTWTDFLRKIPDQPQAELVPPDHPDARKAILHFRVLQAAPVSSLLEIRLETGRMHQIRLQAASRGFPILGDFLYGATHPFGPETDDPRRNWIGLHARHIRFHHPMTRLPVEVTAPWPVPWLELPLGSLLDQAASGSPLE
jgi:23S rRNA pseudouridine1911/1915/1917 synthase